MADIRAVVFESINAIIADRETGDEEDVDVTDDARLYEDLRLDSLELAALSERLSEALGRDPYNDGLAPVTVGDVIAYYEG